MKNFFILGLFYLFLLFGFQFYHAQKFKVDTVFIGNIKDHSIHKFIKKRASVFIVVRHGEKEIGGKNPHLSEEGKSRARSLAVYLKNVKINKAYSSDFYRTRETLEPLLVDKKLELNIYNPSEISDFVRNELLFNKSKNIISGHSNTNPMVLNEICKENFYKDIPENKFNDIYIVNVFNEDKKIKIFHILY